MENQREETLNAVKNPNALWIHVTISVVDVVFVVVVPSFQLVRNEQTKWNGSEKISNSRETEHSTRIHTHLSSAATENRRIQEIERTDRREEEHHRINLYQFIAIYSPHIYTHGTRYGYSKSHLLPNMCICVHNGNITSI